MQDIYRFLDRYDVAYERHDHPPVYTVADVRRLVPPLPGAGVKNLFLRDGKGRRHFLVAVGKDKRVDLKGLAKVLKAGRLSFASPRRLARHLGVEPGAVSLLAVIRDTDHAVEVVVDETLWKAPSLQFHPLVNTSTLVVAREGLRRFLEASGHSPRIEVVPCLVDG